MKQAAADEGTIYHCDLLVFIHHHYPPCIKNKSHKMSDLTIYTLFYYQLHGSLLVYILLLQEILTSLLKVKMLLTDFFPLQYKFKASLIVVSSKLLAY